MRIRTKLTLIFLLLAVVPLTGIVFYNYWSSLQTFRQAVEREVVAEAEELTARLDTAKQDLGRQLQAFGSISLQELSPDTGATASGTTSSGNDVAAAIRLELGELAPVVQSVEVIPAAPEAPAPIAPIDIPSELHLSERGLGLPESFVIYLDQVMEEAATADATGEALEHARQATELFLQELGGEESREALRLEAEGERLEEQLEIHERQVEALDEAIHEPDLSSTQRRQLVREQEAARRALKKLARERGRLEAREIENLQTGWERAQSLLGDSFAWEILEQGQVLGQLRAQISPENLLGAVLSQTRPEQGEIPFALDGEGRIYTVTSEAEEIIADLDPADLHRSEDDTTQMAFRRDWLVVASPDPDSEVVLGIARPIGKSLASMRATAARNFGLGLGMITLALIGIMPLSSRVTRNLTKLSHSVDQMAAGNLDIKVDVTSRDEVGHLANAVNRMAGDLQQNQERLIDEIQRRKEQETRERLLAAENDRKSAELEEARRFQLSLLPADLPRHAELELEVHMQTATEVGGDYYDFLPSDDGGLTIAVGDATGHGAKAGTMVTAIKSLFMARGTDVDPRTFLSESSRTVKRMRLGRMAMALSVVRYAAGRLTVAAAGMPPALLWRRQASEVEEIELSGPPLGGLVGSAYEQTSTTMAVGDVLLLMTDGFPELPDPDGEPLGYAAVRRQFAEVAERTPTEIVSALNAAADRWRRSQPLIDDITFVVARRTA